MAQKEISLIHDNKLGYAASCHNCNEIQLVIGNLFFHVSTEKFKNFIHCMIRDKEAMFAEFNKMSPCQKLLLRTKDENLKIAVNKKELYQLFELIEITSLMLEVDNLLKV